MVKNAEEKAREKLEHGQRKLIHAWWKPYNAVIDMEAVIIFSASV